MRLFRRAPAILAVAAFVVLVSASSRADDQNHHHHPSHHSSHHSRSSHSSHHTRHVMRNGNAVERRNGHVQRVHDERRHMDIEHHLNGGRRISVERPDHSRIVAEYRHGAYIEHPYAFHGHDYYHRTFYRNGRVVGWHLYRGYYYHGYGLHVWVPRYYFHPAFYGWAYHPWHTRIYYAWPWVHWPRFDAYYSYYFQPYPYYDDPSEWLTDYALATDLHTEYLADNPGSGAGSPPPAAADEGQPPEGDDGQPSPATNPGQPPAPILSPEVKAEVDKEIQYELQVEAGEAALDAADQEADSNNAPTGIGRLFADNKPHVFVVADPVDVANQATGNDCSLTNGDILRTTTPPGPDDKAATLTVIAAKGQPQECALSSTVSVNLDDLQEMQNSLDEAIQNGMQKLQQKQDTGGLPALPADAQGTTTPPYAQAAPPPDTSAGPDIQQQIRESNQSEQEVTSQETQEPDTNAPPAEAPAPAAQSATQPLATQAPAPIERRPPE